MRITITITTLAIVLIGSIIPAFATSQFRQLRVETPSWVNEIHNKETPEPPAPVAKHIQPLPYTEVGSAEIAAPVPPPIIVEDPVVSYSQPTETDHSFGVAEAAAPANVTVPEPKWFKSVPKVTVGASYVAKDPAQFNYQVNFRYVGADGNPLAAPEPSSIVGLAAPLLGSFVYWRRRRTA